MKKQNSNAAALTPNYQHAKTCLSNANSWHANGADDTTIHALIREAIDHGASENDIIQQTTTEVRKAYNRANIKANGGDVRGKKKAARRPAKGLGFGDGWRAVVTDLRSAAPRGGATVTITTEDAERLALMIQQFAEEIDRLNARDIEGELHDARAQRDALIRRVDVLRRDRDKMISALKAAESMAWEIGTETDDGVHVLCEDGRGDLYRQIVAATSNDTEGN